MPFDRSRRLQSLASRCAAISQRPQIVDHLGGLEIAQIDQKRLAASTLLAFCGVVERASVIARVHPLSAGADYASFAQREKVLPRIEVRRKLGIADTPDGG